MRLFGKVLFLTMTTCIASFAATLEDAQKAYVSGNWKGAAEAFESVCPFANKLSISWKIRQVTFFPICLTETISESHVSVAVRHDCS